MITTLQQLKDFESRCLVLNKNLIINETNFKNNIDNHNTGHIRATIQNIILKFGEPHPDLTFVLKGEIIAQEVMDTKNPTQSNVWCPLIWKALDECGYEIPNYTYFKSNMNNVRFLSNFTIDNFNEKITELSNINGWCEYAVRVLNYEFINIPRYSNDFYHHFVKQKSKEIFEMGK